MLSLQTVLPDTMELMKELMQLPVLEHFSYEELIKLYLKKYPDGSEYRALLSMSYFADADPQAMPYMFEEVSWSAIKQRIKEEQMRYTTNYS